MAKMQIKNICFFTWLFFFAFSETNAIPKRDIENLCKETPDAAFCNSNLWNDPRIPVARELSDVLIIVISLSRKQVQDAMIHIINIRGTYNGRSEMNQIDLCNVNYHDASERFDDATDQALKKMYTGVIVWAGSAKDAVTSCESAWGKNGSIEKSPLTLYNTNVAKLYDIILVITKKLGVTGI